MPAFLTNPDIPAVDLRQRIYSGDLIILTRLHALTEFVDYMREELTSGTSCTWATRSRNGTAT